MTGAGYTVAAAAAGGYSEVLRSSAPRPGLGAGLLGVAVAWRGGAGLLYNLIQRIQQCNNYHLKRYIENRKLETSQANNETIRHWIRGVLEMEKKTSQHEHQDIQN